MQSFQSKSSQDSYASAMRYNSRSEPDNVSRLILPEAVNLHAHFVALQSELTRKMQQTSGDTQKMQAAFAASAFLTILQSSSKDCVSDVADSLLEQTAQMLSHMQSIQARVDSRTESAAQPSATQISKQSSLRAPSGQAVTCKEDHAKGQTSGAITLDSPLRDIDISIHTLMLLNLKQIHTVREAVALSSRDYICGRGFSAASVARIKAGLEKFGFQIKDNLC